jgi:hypothetical protein
LSSFCKIYLFFFFFSFFEKHNKGFGYELVYRIKLV